MENFCNFDISKNDVYGRYAIASKNLEPGDLIISEAPFTYGPKSNTQPVCLGCHCGIDGSYMCTNCGWPVCNEQCEKHPIHSENECPIFCKAKIKFTAVEDLTLSCPQYECIMPLRVLLTKEKQEDKWEKEIKTLESHESERKGSDIWEAESVNVVRFLHTVCKLQDRFPEELIHFVCGILEVNAFVAPVGYGYDMRCIYPRTSLLAHSCVPNVGQYIFSKSEDNVNYKIYVRAVVKIAKGEDLLLTYTQTLSPTLFRRAHLKEGKFFDCTCRRCADPTELETNLSTLKCTKCDNGWVRTTNSLDAIAQWKCTCCDFSTKGESVMKALRCVEKEIEELNYVENTDPVACREAFLKKYRSIFHPNHALMLTVKSSLSQLYGKTTGYLLEDLPNILLERKIELCNQMEKISNVIKPGLSRQRGWNLYELHAPLIVLAKSQVQNNEISEKQLRVKLEEAAKYLEETALIFSYEDPESPEGIVGKIAMQSLKDLKTSIETLPI